MDRVRIGARRREPDFPAARGRRRAAQADDALDRRGAGGVVAGWQGARVCLRRVSGIFCEALQGVRPAEPRETGGSRQEQGKGPGLYPAPLPPLGFVGGGQAPASLCRPDRGRWHAGRAARRHSRRQRRRADLQYVHGRRRVYLFTRWPGARLFRPARRAARAGLEHQSRPLVRRPRDGRTHAAHNESGRGRPATIFTQR